MKWNTYKKALSGHPKTFLVLPSVDSEMSRNTGLRLFTKAWPPKNDDKEENCRPLTATLEKPQVLDIRLVGKIDMSLMRKEFLSLTNLCRIPARAKARRKTAVLDRRRHVSNLPVAIPPSDRSKLLKKPEATSEEDDSSLSSTKKPRSKIPPPKAVIPKKSPTPEEINNNLKTIVAPQTKSAESIKHLPEPCTTCGRPDQPERFHSHPTTPLKPIKKQEVKVQVKSTVQKPVAMRYKSRVEDRKEAVSPRKVQEGESSKTAAKMAPGPRTLTCYICGREFGTASLPLHEPKCLQKWQRENAALPVHLQQKAPVKPDQPLSKEEWNKFAWESSQAALTPCPNCGRTFFPDRLLVHQRACKGNGGEFSRTSEQQRSSLNKTPPKTVMCSVCGKLFGTKSIKIHEPQCLKKWHAQNDHLPPNQREPLASKKMKTTKTINPSSKDNNVRRNVPHLRSDL